ncbi:CotH kinase family protein [Paenibacillus humicola]|uniref:CotH kinase family protein n=1 Tax=Paenibacillus humicola TaxID=3110540 RepID=UPI00237ADBA4|nr:CotH kinase family protein [Paenibacillus humicola]
MSDLSAPVRKITIDPDDLRQLQSNVWSRQFVPVKLEMDGRTFDAQIRYRGGHTRNYPKKSYEVLVEGKLTLHWNAESDDPSMIRNALSFRFFEMIGVPSPTAQHFWLEWNGQQHGVYLELESVDATFFKKRGIQAHSLIYAVNDNATFGLIDRDTKLRKESLFSGYRLMMGESSAETRLVRFIRRINRPANRSLRLYLRKKLDVSQYLQWLAGAVLTGNYDGFDQNYALYEHLPSKRLRMIPWDYEGTWGRNCYGKLCGSDLVPIQGHNKLTRKVLAYRSNRVAYRRLLRKLLAGPFSVEQIAPEIDTIYAALAPAIRDDFTRKWPFSAFQEEPDQIKQYIAERREIVRRELRRWAKADAAK